jgi:Asp-tRNA(Asn)/Glu-tRNA(Gln) amidotransferase A subunit family amidase
MSELTVKSAAEQIQLLQDRCLSAEELALEYLREIERLNPRLHAYVDLDEDRALSAARDADTRRARLKPSEQPSLLGLPLSVKSSLSVAGYLCETGTEIYRGHRPAQDAVSVARLRAEGAVILGVTNCPEFLMAYETDNLLYGRTANPWDLDRQAGGSSGGESSAIAAGISSGGIGSDSGGSVRVPAHFTGICSLKPTSGRISPEGHTLPCVGPFSTLGALGPMARSIEDVAMLFNALRTSPAPPPTFDFLRSRPIGVLEDDGHVPVTQETRNAVRDAACALKDAGFRVVPFSSRLLEDVRKLWRIFFIGCGRIFLETSIAGHTKFSPTFEYFLQTAGAEPLLHAPELLSAWVESQRVQAAFTEALSSYTALLTPVCSVPAFRHGERSWSIEGVPVEYFDAMRFTQWFNVLGAPAAVVPVGRSPEDLPIGVQIAANPGCDEAVLAIADLMDRQFGYRPPPMALAG